jgi:acyl-CoA thioesterase
MDEKAIKIVQMMLSKDAFSQWLGLEILEIAAGRCTLKAEIRQEMLNGFGMSHGGITFSMADSAFAFASNSRGMEAVSIETSISHVRPVFAGDTITAVATEKNLSNSFGLYEVNLSNQNNKKVAFFKGTVFRTGKEWKTD